MCDLHTSTVFESNVIAELWRPPAALRSPILIEPVYSFSHGHHRQQHMAHGCICTGDNKTLHNMVAILQLTGQPRHAALVYSVHL